MKVGPREIGRPGLFPSARNGQRPANETLVKKHAGDRVQHASLELDHVQHRFFIASPRKGKTLEEQTVDALVALDRCVAQLEARGSLVQQTVFLAHPRLIDPCRNMVRDFYGPDLPATSYVPQRPCDGSLLAIEACAVSSLENEVRLDRLNEHLVKVLFSDLTWVHCANVNSPREGGVYDGSLRAFQDMNALLQGAGVRFDQVVRTWLYLGDIVGPEGETQRYKELNRARTDYYEPIHFLTDRLAPGREGRYFPASTGIGADHRGVVMGCIALATSRKDILATPLENPRQVSAFDYAANYSPRSPKFSRAMAISSLVNATIFVSGTASITQSETRHVGDPVAQTHETLNNIEALIAEDNLRRHGLPGLGATLADLGMARVYIKLPEHCEAIQAACRERLGDVPTIYTYADVCRPDLLVEIEGMAFSQRPPLNP